MNKESKQTRIHRLFGIKVKSKLAAASIDSAIKVIIAIVVGSLFLGGIYGVINKIVLPNTKTAVQNIAAYESNGEGEGGSTIPGGSGGSGEVLPEEFATYSYYSTLALAINDANNKTTDNADVNEDEAIAAILEYKDKTAVKVMNNTVVSESIDVSGQYTINLGGKTVELSPGAYFNVTSGADVVFTDEQSGGQLTKTYNNYTVNDYIISGTDGAVETNNIVMNMNGSSTARMCAVMMNGGSMNINENTDINITNTSSGAVMGIRADGATTVEFNDCDIDTTASGNNYGAYISGTSTITSNNTDIYSISNSGTARAAAVNTTASGTFNSGNYKSVGETGTQNIYALDIFGTVIVNGGTYESDLLADSSKAAYGIFVRKDAEINGGTFEATAPDAKAFGMYVQSPIADGYNVVINDGTFKSLNESADNKLSVGVAVVNGLTINNGTFISNQCGIFNQGTTLINNGTFISNTETSESYGILNNVSGTMVINNATAQGYTGISNFNNMTIKDSTTWGYHSGISTLGTGITRIYGGTYESPWHGGAYFSGENNYVYNAIFSDDSDYEGEQNHYGGIYIGNSDNKVTVYMDNCTINGGAYGAVLSSNYSYLNTYLFISNSTLKGKTADLRVDGKNSNGNFGTVHVGENVTYSTTTGTGVIDKDSYAGVNFSANELPSEYQQVEYIQSSGTQWIDTGFTPNQNTRVVCNYEVVDTSASFIYGSRTSSSSNGFTLNIGSGNQLVTAYGNSGALALSAIDTERHVVNKNQKAVYLDGVSKVQATSQTFTAPGTLELFACNNAGAKGYLPSKTKMYSCQVYDNGTLIRDFVPCYRTSDNKSGMYDKVNNIFYINGGTGNFTVGYDI